MNTKIEYMYRNADNYKAFGTVVLEGALTGPEKEELLGCLHRDMDDNMFLPGCVGIPRLHLDEEPDVELDGPWHWLLSVEDTDMRPTHDVEPDGADGPLDAQGLLAQFRQMAGRWPEFEAQETGRLFDW